MAGIAARETVKVNLAAAICGQFTSESDVASALLPMQTLAVNLKAYHSDPSKYLLTH